MTPTDIVAHVAAGCLAASRLLSGAQPLWDKLPKWLAVSAPVLVLTLPQIADMAGVVHTETDLIQFFVVSAALVLPGATLAVVVSKKPVTKDETKP